ncbi:hypothetical protein [Bacillus phage Megatron]|nr:hypothetical protein FP75_gp103 [Bacillus phage Megatron]YP_009285051.1 hypothetical protein BIZ88_gp109 [Bacillus phage DirtyBetty]ANI24722.1 hypothetical protein SMUDGE_103 [Bacillus phage Smudge]ASR78754.1 hypothetical protein BUBS_110 [Bacillus phage Bubs]ASR79205.1 hypothetical protein ZAINNY_109 [Bacillus phage Zainny]QDH49381.1 hypothetical protein PHIREBALL_107 [Bacillus phage Phireball]QDH50088.1 hypothetical protein ALPS_102 [Bacillus phage ALPS]ULF49016.1 hypothetical protein [
MTELKKYYEVPFDYNNRKSTIKDAWAKLTADMYAYDGTVLSQYNVYMMEAGFLQRFNGWSYVPTDTPYVNMYPVDTMDPIDFEKKIWVIIRAQLKKVVLGEMRFYLTTYKADPYELTSVPPLRYPR